METPESDRIELIKGAVPSVLLNLGFLLLAKGDQRVLLFLMFSIVGGLVMLAGEKTDSYGMGLILGAAAATAIAVALALAGASPHDFHPGR